MRPCQNVMHRHVSMTGLTHEAGISSWSRRPATTPCSSSRDRLTRLLPSRPRLGRGARMSEGPPVSRAIHGLHGPPELGVLHHDSSSTTDAARVIGHRRRTVSGTAGAAPETGSNEPSPPGGLQRRVTPCWRTSSSGTVSGMVTPSVTAMRSETSRRTAESGASRAWQMEASSSEEASF